MFLFKKITLRSFERAALYKKGEFERMLGAGEHWLFDPRGELRVEMFSLRDPWIKSASLDVLVKAEAFGDEAVVIELTDGERGLVWIDGRFARILPPGRYALWTNFCKVRVEVVRTEPLRLQLPELDSIIESSGASSFIETFLVAEGQVGLIYIGGKLSEQLGPGRYAYWKGVLPVRMFAADMRESVLEISGQELMTADKVSLRLNVLLTFAVVDVQRAVSVVSDFQNALYRAGQLALRAMVGGVSLDELLARKEALTRDIERSVGERAAQMGLAVRALGIRDIILPGDMRELLNKVTEAKKAAEASVITRREETAAIRSQLNTARLMESNPTLLRLRELETLERVTAGAEIKVVVGDKGMTENVLKLL